MSYFSLFQSTHPARGATPPETWGPSRPLNFNPRTPRGVRRQKPPEQEDKPIFQSTHPARGATEYTTEISGALKFQSTHPARGATPACLRYTQIQLYFNPRTPRGVRRLMARSRRTPDDFNPRTPRGVRLLLAVLKRRMIVISIHAPREGCDLSSCLYGSPTIDFNPRTPRGVRLSNFLDPSSST